MFWTRTIGLVVALTLACAATAQAQGVSLTTTVWLPGPGAVGLSTLSGTVDQPASVSSTQLTGWVVDTTAQGWSGIDDVQVWNGLMGGGGQQFGHALIQLDRPDVAATLGNPYWAASGFSLGVPPRTFATASTLYVYAHTPDKGWWYEQVLATESAAGFLVGPRLDIETPTPLATVHSAAAYTIRGTAYDPSASPQQGIGVDRVQVYLNGDRGSGISIGDAALGSFDKFAAARNPQFANAGWQLSFQPNSWLGSISNNQLTQLTVYAHSSVTGLESRVETSIVISVP